MKKFRLIKKYPKSPPIGTIVEVGNDGYCSYQMSDDYHKLNTHLHKDVIKDYSEFWEEVVEKDYEILNLALARSIKHEVRDFEDCSEKYIKGLLACKGNYIHSVKRLSDGVIFTVGDKCKDINTNCITTVSEITLKDTICFINGVNINYLKKVKQKLNK